MDIRIFLTDKDEKEARRPPQQPRGRTAEDPFHFATCDPDIRSRRIMENWPAWTSSQPYDYLKDANDKQWGWELLRRNPFYVRDYNEWKWFHSQYNAGLNGRYCVTLKELHELSREITDKYGLSAEEYPLSPSFPRPPLVSKERFGRRSSVLRVSINNNIEFDTRMPDSPTYTIIAIYPDAPKNEQISTFNHYYNYMRDELGLNKPKPPCRTRDELVRYLRILDAKASWATNTEIVEVLYKDHQGTPLSKRLSRDYKRARELSLAGYLQFFARAVHE